MNPLYVGGIHASIIGDNPNNVNDWCNTFFNEIYESANKQNQVETIISIVNSTGFEKVVNNNSNEDKLKQFIFDLSAIVPFENNLNLSIDEKDFRKSYSVCIINGRIVSARDVTFKTLPEDTPYSFNPRFSVKNTLNQLYDSIQNTDYLTLSIVRPVFLIISEESIQEILFDHYLNPIYIARAIVFFRRKCDGYLHEQVDIIEKYKKIDKNNIVGDPYSWNSNSKTMETKLENEPELIKVKNKSILNAVLNDNQKYKITKRIIAGILDLNMPMDYNHIYSNVIKISFDRIGYVKIKFNKNIKEYRYANYTISELMKIILPDYKGLDYE